MRHLLVREKHEGNACKNIEGDDIASAGHALAATEFSIMWLQSQAFVFLLLTYHC